jgi:ribosomal protein S18 acetylase RimI-like enzyme
VPLDSTTLGEVAAFMSAQTGGWMSVERVVDVITTIVAGPEKVLDLWRGGRRVAAATLIDTCSTQGNAAELSVFVDDPEQSPEDAMDELLAWAEERLHGGPRSNLDIPIWPGITIPDSWLRRHGFEKAYTYFEMERDGEEGAHGPPEKALPDGFAWQSYDDRLFPGFFETLRLAFENVPGAFVPSEEATRERARRYPVPPPALLMQGERVAGFVRIELGGNGTGEIASLGRHPDFKGLGIGELLVKRGIEMLKANGVRQQRLEVTAVNARAVELYERFGFRRCREYVVHRRPIRARSGDPLSADPPQRAPEMP